MFMKQLPNTPAKGTADWFPEEFKVRKHIFDTWRKVCQWYGFDEYLWPLVESVDIWKAKSWEDVGGSELTQITNRDGELDGLAIRPEMTPTVTRMVSRKWKEIDKPVKWFSIANFYRNEKPQKGRNREFWQLNADIFGEESVNADIEILSLALDLMAAFNPPKGSFTLKLNHRALINTFFDEILQLSDEDTKRDLMRLLDKYEKLKKDVFNDELKKLWLKDSDVIHTFMQAKTLWELKEAFISLAGNEVFQNFETVMSQLVVLGYEDEIEFSGSLIRGFDYYDGIIFEMFDNNPDNPRALFWGGRYNGLADIFGVKGGISAIWFAPWDETMKLFLEGHNMLEAVLNDYGESYYFPLLEEELFSEAQIIAKTLRAQGKNVNLWLGVKKLGKALKYADKNNYSHIVVYGEQEKQAWEYRVKDLKAGREQKISI